MYEYIKGTVTFVSPYYMVIEANQIGYQVAVANPFKYSAYLEQEVKVYLHQVIREDAHVLYGFSNLEEKQLFLKLISVSGIGPKVMAIMALDDHAGLVTAIESEDAKYLTKFPGVGKKTAQQMILDLKGKLGELEITGQPKGVVAGVQDDLFTTVDDTSLQEAIEALKALGYSEREIKRIKKELEVMTGKATDEILRHGLKLLMKK